MAPPATFSVACQNGFCKGSNPGYGLSECDYDDECECECHDPEPEPGGADA
jgi:hypothetical protein